MLTPSPEQRAGCQGLQGQSWTPWEPRGDGGTQGGLSTARRLPQPTAAPQPGLPQLGHASAAQQLHSCAILGQEGQRAPGSLGGWEAPVPQKLHAQPMALLQRQVDGSLPVLQRGDTAAGIAPTKDGGLRGTAPSANLVPQLRVPPVLQQQLQAPAAPPGRSDVQRREPLGSPTTVPASPPSCRRLRSPLGRTGPSSPRPLPGIGIPSVAQQQPQAAHSTPGPPRSAQMDGGEPPCKQQVGVGSVPQEDLRRPAGGQRGGHRPYRSITRAAATRQSDSPGCKAYTAAATPDPSPYHVRPPTPDPPPSRCPLTPRARPAALRTAAPPPRAAPRHSCRPAHAPPGFEFPARRR